jgi:hypothetical protein
LDINEISFCIEKAVHVSLPVERDISWAETIRNGCLGSCIKGAMAVMAC